LDSVFTKYGKVESNGKVILDLTSLGYDKLLGGGKPTGAFTVRVPRVSRIAKERIESIGGEVVK
jgi:large subunit ribosomal protein L15